MKNIEMQAILEILQKGFNLDINKFSYIKQKYLKSCCCCCFVCEHCFRIYKCKAKYKKFKCTHCDCDIHENTFYFSPFIKYLEESMKDPLFVSDVLYYKSHKYENGAMNHFYDGWLFKNMKKRYFEKEQQNEINLGVIFNTDGFSVNKTCSMWPFFQSIINVSREKRKLIKYNHMCAFAKKTKSNVVFQAVTFLIAKELLQLMKGIKSEIMFSRASCCAFLWICQLVAKFFFKIFSTVIPVAVFVTIKAQSLARKFVFQLNHKLTGGQEVQFWRIFYSKTMVSSMDIVNFSNYLISVLIYLWLLI